VEQKNGKIHQKWKLVYVEDYKPEPAKGQFHPRFGLYVERNFYIVSQLPSGKYLEIPDHRNLAIKTRNGRKTQVWYFHRETLTIRSAYTHQSFEIRNNGKTNDLRVWATNSAWFQVFKYENNQFIN